MSAHLTRREWFTRTSAAVAVAAAGPVSRSAAATEASWPKTITFSLNTSTLMGQKLPLVQEVEIAAKAGYGAIEPWIRELDEHVKQGGSLKDLGKRIRDHGLIVPDAIGFFEWIVDDDARRKKGMEEAKRCMDLAQQIGCQRLAAPPLGATSQEDFDVRRGAERYRVLLEMSDGFGVVPQLEVWGHSRVLGRLSDAAQVALECGHPKACILGDVFHYYKGGTPFTGLKLLSSNAMQVLHMNDYPAQPPREKITDAERIYPGDGVAPYKEIIRCLRQAGFHGFLSLELFNRTYWKQDPQKVARTGLEKMRAVVQAGIV